MKHNSLRNLAVTGLFAAVAAVLMVIQISVPILPGFLKFDFSDFPALIVSFAVSPWHGVAVCLLKNLIHLPFSDTAYIGELNNFAISAVLVLTAGLIYHRKKTKGTAILGASAGTLVSGVVSVLYNYYIGYPLFILVSFKMASLEVGTGVILNMYRAILPSVSNLWQALLIFNLPLTLAKGLVATAITVLIYKRISPMLKGKKTK